MDIFQCIRHMCFASVGKSMCIYPVFKTCLFCFYREKYGYLSSVLDTSVSVGKSMCTYLVY